MSHIESQYSLLESKPIFRGMYSSLVDETEWANKTAYGTAMNEIHRAEYELGGYV